VLELYAIADAHADPGPDDPPAITCLDEFRPLNLQQSDERMEPGTTATATALTHDQIAA